MYFKYSPLGIWKCSDCVVFFVFILLMIRTLGLLEIYRFFKKMSVFVNRSHIPWVEKYLLCHEDTSDYMGSTASLGSFMGDDDSLGATNPHFSK